MQKNYNRPNQFVLMSKEQKGRLALSQMFRDCYELVDDLPTFRIFVNGEWRESEKGETFPVDSPIDDSIIANVQSGSMKDAEEAVLSAYNARNKIRDIPAIDRIDILNRARHIID